MAELRGVQYNKSLMIKTDITQSNKMM